MINQFDPVKNLDYFQLAIVVACIIIASETLNKQAKVRFKDTHESLLGAKIAERIVELVLLVQISFTSNLVMLSHRH